MRIMYRRYRRDVARYVLAERMLQLEARTHTIRQWTGLSGRMVRALYNSYMRGESEGENVARHRGPWPRRPAYFLRPARLRREASALAGLCNLMDVIPSGPISDAARDVPGLQRGKLLCNAFELFEAFVGHTDLTLDHAVLLVLAIAEGEQLRLGRCVHCGAAMIFDPLSTDPRLCVDCDGDTHAEPAVRPETEVRGEPAGAAAPAQQSLF